MSLSERIIGAFFFRNEAYADVEHDPSFTPTAWIIVAITGFLSQLGGNSLVLANEGLVNYAVAAGVGTISVLVGFALAAWIISWVGSSIYRAEVTFDQMVRTLGLAYVWNIVGLFGLVGGFSVALGCLLAPVLVLGAILGLVAWFVAAKEALDLSWGQTIVTVIAGWVVYFVVGLVFGAILGLLGIGVSGLTGVLGA